MDSSASNKYSLKSPGIQNALDIFKDEWISKLPGDYGQFRAGENTTLFDDPRLIWGIGVFGGVKNSKILELGPLEGAHTYMLQDHGASEIISIEANHRAFLRCLIIKEIFDLHHAKFQCGDFLEYLREEPDCFDLCIASGVLYHLQNPAELISLLSKVSSKVLIWTHYFEPAIISKNPALEAKFLPSQQLEYGGFTYTGHAYQYQGEREKLGFCGGGLEFAHWISRQDLMDSLQFFGWRNVIIKDDDPYHQNGPAITLAAMKE